MSHAGLGLLMKARDDVMKLNDYELIEQAKSVERQGSAVDASKVMLELANRLGLRVVTLRYHPQGILMVDLHSNCRYLTRCESFMYRVFNRLPKGLKLLTHAPEWPIL